MLLCSYELNTLDAGRSRSMCGVIVVDAGRSRSTWYGRDAYIHDHCLRYRHNFALSVNCSAVICSPTVIFSILREASSETYGPWVYFPSYKFPIYDSSFLFTFFLQSYTFRSINQKYQKYYFTVYPSLSDLTLQITVKGLTTPLSRWCLFVQVFGGLLRSLLLDWYLDSQNRGK